MRRRGAAAKVHSCRPYTHIKGGEEEAAGCYVFIEMSSPAFAIYADCRERERHRPNRRHLISCFAESPLRRPNLLPSLSPSLSLSLSLSRRLQRQIYTSFPLLSGKQRGKGGRRRRKLQSEKLARRRQRRSANTRPGIIRISADEIMAPLPASVRDPKSVAANGRAARRWSRKNLVLTQCASAAIISHQRGQAAVALLEKGVKSFSGFCCTPLFSPLSLSLSLSLSLCNLHKLQKQETTFR